MLSPSSQAPTVCRSSSMAAAESDCSLAGHRGWTVVCWNSRNLHRTRQFGLYDCGRQDCHEHGRAGVFAVGYCEIAPVHGVQAWSGSMALPRMAMVVPAGWQFEFLECSRLAVGNSSVKTCTNRTAQCEECSVSQLYAQPNMAAAEAGGTTRCFPGVANDLNQTEISLQGKFGAGIYSYAEVVRPSRCILC